MGFGAPGRSRPQVAVLVGSPPARGLLSSVSADPQEVLVARHYHRYAQLLGGCRGAFSRYLRTATMSSLSNPLLVGGHGCALPAPFPFRPALLDGVAPRGGGRRARFNRTRRAMLWVNALVCYWNFLELGSPQGKTDGPLVCLSASAEVPEWGWALLSEVRAFGSLEERVSSGSVGRDQLEELLSSCPLGRYGETCEGAQFGGATAEGPLKVVSSLTAMPGKAGVVRPADVLCPERAAVVRDLDKIVLDADARGPIPYACHAVDPDEELLLYARMLQAGVAVLVPEEDVAQRPEGGPLVGGLFGVWKANKKGLEMRLIFDRRPQNAEEARLGWLRLPEAAQLQRLVLGTYEGARGSGEDLVCYYFYLEHERKWIVRQAVGRPVTGAFAGRFGGDPERRYYVAFRVWGMGDLNACDVAQCVHETILEEGDAYPQAARLYHGQPFPDSNPVVGVYIDDLLIVLRALLADVRSGSQKLAPAPCRVSCSQRRGKGSSGSEAKLEAQDWHAEQEVFARQIKASRTAAARLAEDVLAEVDRAGRKVAEAEVLMVLRRWGFAKNRTRKNVMKEHVHAVASDTFGLISLRGAGTACKKESREFPVVARLLNRWLHDWLPEDLSAHFFHTSIAVNKGYSAACHRDARNVGPSIVKALGVFSGGQIGYHDSDDGSTPIAGLEKLCSPEMLHDISSDFLLFDGRRGHWVENFEGERFSLVFYACPGCEEVDGDTAHQLRACGFAPASAARLRASLALLHDVPWHEWAARGAHQREAVEQAKNFWGARLSGAESGDEWVPGDDTSCDAVAPDVALQRRARLAYARAGLDRSEAKAFEQVPRFRAWGADFDGIVGELAAPLMGRRQLFRIVMRLCAVRVATRRMLQQVQGFFANAFGFRRCLFSLLHHCYTFTAALPETGWNRVPQPILEELWAAAMHLPMAVADLRRPVATVLKATDATPIGGGACECVVSQEIADTLYRRSEVHGEHVRLDTFGFSDGTASKLLPRDPQVDAFVTSCPWRVTSGYQFRRAHHVNLQEMRAIKQDLLATLRRFGRRARGRWIYFCDSRVCVGALGKGRSSSYKLNGILRTLVGPMIIGGLVVAMVWIGTKANPADAPSRALVLSPPRELPDWVRQVDRYATSWTPTTLVVALTGAFAGAFADRRWHCSHLHWDAATLDAASSWLSGIGLLWLSVPALGATRRRGRSCLDPTSAAPYWDLWVRALAWADLALQSNIYVVIEHFDSSPWWSHSLIRRFRARWEGLQVTKLDLCVWQHEPIRVQGKMRLLSSAPWVPFLSGTCSGLHVHCDPGRAVAVDSREAVLGRAAAVAYGEWLQA